LEEDPWFEGLVELIVGTLYIAEGQHSVCHDHSYRKSNVVLLSHVLAAWADKACVELLATV